MSDDKMKRLEDARIKVDDVSKKKERLSGELEADTRRLEELDKRSQDEFETDVDELPDLVEGLNTEGEKHLKEAERLLEV